MRPHKAALSRNRRKTDADLGFAHRFGKSLFRQTRIVAHELTGAIHDHLWRINRSEAEPLPVSGLAIGLRTVYTPQIDRKSTRLNSSHLVISYAVFCLKKKKLQQSTSITRIVS